ncbi:MAG: sigma-70 family RNA polymerase sigma factor [Ktedonobacteraceae bacterium]|nr:sigma-70 family RNA polymerase sigma factor [Ktedonobacteraceae bacterium]
MIDLNDPTLAERLQRRTAEGRYEISETELVLTIRTLKASHEMSGVQYLAEVLLQRCAPVFQRHTQGLRHRPDLREDAIANMAEHLLREAQDAQEVFMTQNFGYYLRCLCVDEFNRMLRQEGLQYRRDEKGRPLGRPQHVPRALVEPLRPIPPDDESGPVADVADGYDQYEQLHAEEESRRILLYLRDPLDRMIMVLRGIEGMKWDDIAVVCKKTERTVRLRYERARTRLRECLAAEQYTMNLPVNAPMTGGVQQQG